MKFSVHVLYYENVQKMTKIVVVRVNALQQPKSWPALSLISDLLKSWPSPSISSLCWGRLLAAAHQTMWCERCGSCRFLTKTTKRL